MGSLALLYWLLVMGFSALWLPALLPLPLLLRLMGA